MVLSNMIGVCFIFADFMVEGKICILVPWFVLYLLSPGNFLFVNLFVYVWNPNWLFVI